MKNRKELKRKVEDMYEYSYDVYALTILALFSGFYDILLTIFAIYFAGFFIVGQGSLLGRGEHAQMNRLSMDGDHCPVAVVFLIDSCVAHVTAGFAFSTGYRTRPVNEIFQAAIQFIAIAGAH